MPVPVLLILPALVLATWVYPLTSAFETLSAGARAADRASVFLVGGVLLLLILVASSRRRVRGVPEAGRREAARRARATFPAVVALALLVLAGLALGFPGVRGPGGAEEPVRVEVVGRQFVWYLRYPGADGRFGTTRLDLVDPVFNPLGIEPGDAAGKDDVVVHDQRLRLPHGRPARLRLRALDVIHSLYLPGFRAQRDAIPGRPAELVLRPLAPGGSELLCAELCGLGHYRMRGRVEILSPASFRAWLESASTDER